jgi:hypothetical protein
VIAGLELRLDLFDDLLDFCRDAAEVAVCTLPQTSYTAWMLDWLNTD